MIDVPGFEQIQLQRFLGLTRDRTADQEKPVRGGPAFGFPVTLEIGAVFIEKAPALARFDLVLEDGEAFERDTDRAFDAIQVHERERVLAEEGTVESGLEHGRRQRVAHPIEGVHHERMGVLAVMDIAGTVKDIEKLSGLRHRTEQVVIAARPFLFGIIAHGGPFGMTTRGDHRAVEVEGQTGEPLALQRLHDQARRQVSHFFDTRTAHSLRARD